MKMKKKASILAASLAVMMLGVQSVYAAPTKPDVKILATGGTIAGSAASDTQTIFLMWICILTEKCSAI